MLAGLLLTQGTDHSVRISQACDMCRKKKIKCDGKLPSCSHCENYKTECVFTQVEKKRTPPKGYVRSLIPRLMPRRIVTGPKSAYKVRTGQSISRASKTDWLAWSTC